MKKSIALFISILLAVIAGLELYAKSIKEFAIDQTANFESEHFLVVYKASILESYGEFVNYIMLGSLICGLSTLMLTKKMSILFRIAVIVFTIIGLFLCLTLFNNNYYFKIE